MHEDIAERFWSRVQRGPDCWTWTGSRLPSGYGRFYPRFRVGLYAHRVSWEMANGTAVPGGLHVCHTCDNPACVRPDHLFVGTRLDNMRDMVAKGRESHHVAAFGEGHHAAKLTADDVRAIRAAAAHGESRAALARRFGVTKANVNQIVWRTAWKHVE